VHPERWVDRLREVKGVAKFVAGVAKLPTERKHIPRWFRSQRKDYLLDEPSPWITFGAIDYVEGFLRARASAPVRVFEYGSGGSTLFWAARGASCVSVEHDEQWFDILRRRVTHLPVDCRLVLPERGAGRAGGDPADPTLYQSTDAAFLDCTFRRYAQTIDQFADESFDIALVDGRARPSCVLHALPKVRRGGILVLDNADRGHYTRLMEPYLAGFQRIVFAGVTPALRELSRTDVFVKPGAP
jgi:predicted O-methyltransferase YrrM